MFLFLAADNFFAANPLILLDTFCIGALFYYKLVIKGEW